MSDFPPFTVPYGKSEFLAIIAALGSFLNATFGHDYGLTRNAQAISAIGVFVLPIGLGFFRSMKHKTAIASNAVVAVAQIQQGVAAAPAPAPVAAPAVDGLTTPVL